jgi:hypothetical protein
VSGDSEKGGKKKQGATRSTQDRIGTSGEPTTFVKSRRAQSVNDHETWVESDVTPTLNVFDIGDIRATTAIIEATPIQDGREIEKHQNGLGVGNEGDPMYTLDQTGGQAVAYSIREDATANNFSATEIETARALQALQPSVQSHHAQTFITQPILLDGRRVDDVRVYTEPVQTLQERMGTGGNNVPVVAQETVVGSLAARDYKGVGNQYVAENKLVIQETILLRNREGKPGGGKGPLISEDISLTLGTSNDQTLFQTGEDSVIGSLAARDYKGVGNQYVAENKLVIQEEVQAISYDGYNQVVEEEIHRPWRIGKDSSDFIADLREPTLIVRRLTPLECERLMGWPDNHTAQSTNGSVSDTQRYKMCGNGVASPVATWIAKHILANGT